VVAAGATVTAWALSKRVSVVLDGGTGGLGEVRLGLGAAPRADKVEICWPNGTRQVIQDLNTRAGYTIHRGAEDPVAGLGTGRAPPPTRPVARPSPPTPPPRPGTVAGVNLATLGSRLVSPAQGPAAKRPLKALYGRRATLLLLLPGSRCKACPAYLRNLSRLGRTWHGKGVAILVVGQTKQKNLPWITSLRWLARPLSTLSRLLLLDGAGKVRVFYLAKLPDPLVLQHHLTRITAD
jgi:hypothetical protein